MIEKFAMIGLVMGFVILLYANLKFMKREARLRAANQIMEMALKKIERWFDEFPVSGHFWDEEKTRPMSYGAAFGSNGERDYMRGIARKALEMKERCDE